MPVQSLGMLKLVWPCLKSILCAGANLRHVSAGAQFGHAAASPNAPASPSCWTKGATKDNKKITERQHERQQKRQQKRSQKDNTKDNGTRM